MNKARGQFRRGSMNATEAAYAQRLELLRRAGEVEWYRFEPFRLRLGVGNSFYCPDFLVLPASGFLEVHEIKGFAREAGMVRLKCAAELFPIFNFRLVRAKPKQLGGGWEVEAV